MQWQMATHKEVRTAYCTLALGDKDNFTVTYFAYKLDEDYLPLLFFSSRLQSGNCKACKLIN